MKSHYVVISSYAINCSETLQPASQDGNKNGKSGNKGVSFQKGERGLPTVSVP